VSWWPRASVSRAARVRKTRRTARPGATPRRPAGSRRPGWSPCAELLTGLRKATAAQVGPYGLAGGYGKADMLGRGPTGPDGAEARSAVPPGEGGPGAQPAPGRDHSTTNVHEAGVDEPDVVKTDGRRIIAMAQGTLYVVDAASRKVSGSLELPGPRGATEHDLLLHGNRVLVVEPFPRVVPLLREEPGSPVPSTRAPGSRLTLVDISAAPRVVSEMTAEGLYVDARQVGSVARVVVRSTPKIEFPLPTPVDQARPEPERIRKNQELVRKAPLTAWQPGFQVTRNGRTETHRVPCERISHPPDYAGTSLLSVLSVNLQGDLRQTDPVSVVADGKTVYGTASSLYVTDSPARGGITPRRLPDQQDARRPTQRTDIYKFDVRGTGRPRYVASGAVPGDLLNQYSLSEYGGNLRVATTLDPTVPVPGSRPGARPSTAPSPPASHSAVHVLAQRGDRLDKVGGLAGLGTGERIHAVRFLGPTGYVVTFRRIDPLYVIDLRDPRRPRAAGELKINGYSAYLHPAGDGLLIGVGQDATDQGQATGTQVSLFDVRDPANPRRLSSYKVESGSSEVEFDPHAFLYWPSSGLAVLPVTRPNAAGTGTSFRATGSEALVLSMRAARVRRLGMISQPEQAGRLVPYASIRRSLIVGGTLWTMSDAGLQASDSATLDRQAWLRFS
jgi:hypothetical protein